jgi:hypothetical protein
LTKKQELEIIKIALRKNIEAVNNIRFLLNNNYSINNLTDFLEFIEKNLQFFLNS